MIRLLRVILALSLVTVVGAGLGGLVGVPFGRRTVFFGATVGGTLAVLQGLGLVTRRGWFDADRRRGGAIGGLVGLALGAPLVVMGLEQPWLVAVGVLLVGTCAVLGAGPGATR